MELGLSWMKLHTDGAAGVGGAVFLRTVPPHQLVKVGTQNIPPYFLLSTNKTFSQSVPTDVI